MGWVVPGCVLATGLATTLVWGITQQHDLRDDEARRFAEIAGRFAAQVDEGILMREQIVVGIAAIAGMDAKRSQSMDWGEYITRLSRDSERDLAPTAGFMPKVESADLLKHELEQRRAGHRDYRVWPPGERAVYYPLARLEPPGQKAVLGYDGYSEPVRHAAMNRALTMRTPAMTSMVILKSHTDGNDTPAFLVYAPVLAGAYPDVAQTDRRRAIGLVGTACRINDLLMSVLDSSQGEAEVAMTSMPIRLTTKQWYGANGLVHDHRASPLFSARVTLAHGGQAWELELSSTQAFEAAYNRRQPTGSLIVGVAATLSLTLLAWFFDRSRRLALSESDRRFRKMADAAPVPVWLLDANLNCTYANRAHVSLSGIQPDASAGHGWLSVIHPDDRAAVQTALRYADGDGDRYEVEYRLQHAEGGYFWVLDRGELRRDEAGKLEGYVGVCTDLTERRETEAALKSAIWAAELGLWSWDIASGTIAFSKEYKAQLGYAEREVEDTLTAWQELLHPDDVLRTLASLRSRVASDALLFEAEYRMRHRDGSWRHILSRAQIQRDPKGEAQRLLGGHLDVTEFRLAQEALRTHRDALETEVRERTAQLSAAKDAAESANRAKSDFLTNMSHELRTPMHAILSFSEMGLRKAIGTESPMPRLQQYFDRIIQSGQRLLVLLNDLLDLSKLEAGQMSYQPSMHNVAAIVQSVVCELEAYARERSVRVQVEVTDEAVTAPCDAVRIAQVVHNLLSNAIKFTAAASSVSITVGAGELESMGPGDVTLPQRAVLIKVSDQGIGIPEAELTLVFDKFTQSSKTKTGAGGTGLGLTISREIIAQHGGRIWAANNAAGGADLMVLLPRDHAGHNSLQASAKQEEKAA